MLLNIIIVRIKGPRPYVGPWVLSKDIDRSKEEEQIVVKRSQLKSQRWRTGERLSKEELLLGYDEYGSQYELYQLV